MNNRNLNTVNLQNRVISKNVPLSQLQINAPDNILQFMKRFLLHVMKTKNSDIFFDKEIIFRIIQLCKYSPFCQNSYVLYCPNMLRREIISEYMNIRE